MKRRNFLKALLAVPAIGLLPKAQAAEKLPTIIINKRQNGETWRVEGSKDLSFSKPYTYKAEYLGNRWFELKQLPHLKYLRIVLDDTFVAPDRLWCTDSGGRRYLWLHLRISVYDVGFISMGAHLRDIDCIDFSLLHKQVIVD